MTAEKDKLNAEIKNALLTTPLAQHLDERELDMLFSQSKYVTFSPGEAIIQQGKKSDGMYIIISGTALVTAKILGEGGTYITTLGHGNLLGEVSLIEKEPSTTSVLASSKVTCLLITRAYFEILALLYPETKYKITKAIMKEVSNRFKELHKKITSFISHSDMTSRSLFGEVIKSLTRPTTIPWEEAEISKQEIQKSALFEEFSKEELDELLKQTTVVKAAQDSIVIQEGEKNAPCFIILRGAVQSSIIENSKSAKLSVIGPFCFITGIFSVDEPSISILNYTTCERAVLLKLTEENLNNLRKNHIKLWYKLFDLICVSFAALERSAEKLDVRLNSELYNR